MATSKRRPFTGLEESLVIAIDVGTTFSGVTYALLRPGEVPEIQFVKQFPGQIEIYNSKVPSVICYDQNGSLIAAGFDADAEVNPMLSEMKGVRKAEWFKLRLRPPNLAPDMRAQLEKFWSSQEPVEESDSKEAEFLHTNEMFRPVTDDFKTPTQVFADFLQYLFKCAKEYIVERTPTSARPSFESNTYFVLTHPNGWEGKQHSQMRDAAIAAGLVDKSTAADHITFISEGEASLHFCLDKIPELHQERGGLLVVDCGGGTIDLSAYSRTENDGFNEVTPSDCLLQGSIFITSRARDYFRERFKDSRFGSDDDINLMTRYFERVKHTFHDHNEIKYIKFGRMRDRDPEYGISRGTFKVDGAQVARFFEPAVQGITNAITNQCNSATKNGVSIKYILLVGGFGRSDYLYKRLCDYFNSSCIAVLRPDSVHLNKAVPDGALSWYLDPLVSARIAKLSYGVIGEVEFDPANPEHICRESAKITDADGNTCIPGYFSTILKRGTMIREETEFRQPQYHLLTPAEFLRCTSFTVNLTCYRGRAVTPPECIDLEPDSFHPLCTIEVDMLNIKRNLMPQVHGYEVFYEVNFEVVLLFGLTELKAYVTWQEDGVERRYASSMNDGVRDR